MLLVQLDTRLESSRSEILKETSKLASDDERHALLRDCGVPVQLRCSLNESLRDRKYR